MKFIIKLIAKLLGKAPPANISIGYGPQYAKGGEPGKNGEGGKGGIAINLGSKK